MITDEDRKVAESIFSVATLIDDEQAIAEAFARHRIAAEQRGYQQGMEDAAEVMAERAALYRAKASKRDPFADDNLNTYDSFVMCAEASEYGEAAIRAKLELTPENSDDLEARSV